MLALEPELLICDHAGILEDAQGRLARKIQWWEDLAGKARELRDQGLPVEEIARRLLGREALPDLRQPGGFLQAQSDSRPARRRSDPPSTAPATATGCSTCAGISSKRAVKWRSTLGA